MSQDNTNESHQLSTRIKEVQPISNEVQINLTMGDSQQHEINPTSHHNTVNTSYDLDFRRTFEEMKMNISSGNEKQSRNDFKKLIDMKKEIIYEPHEPDQDTNQAVMPSDTSKEGAKGIQTEEIK
jgi:hypothetical protein